jgi:hypothetical protein
VSNRHTSIEAGLITAMGFANVLTNKDVTFNVRDIFGFGARGSDWWWIKYVFALQSVDHCTVEKYQIIRT